MVGPEGKSSWLITGASGLLGHQLCRQLVGRGHRVVGLAHRHQIAVSGIETIACDLENEGTARKLVEQVRPDVVLHAAGLTSVDGCERDPALAARIHVAVSEELADVANRTGARNVLVSTDHLWDGKKANVTEDEPTNPLNVYGRTKADGEIAVLSANPATMIVRTNFFGFGPPWRKSLSDWLLGILRAGNPVPAFCDVYFTPIALPHLCQAIEEMVDKNASGVFHVAGGERVSKFVFAARLAEHFGFPKTLVKESRLADARLGAARPLDMSLSTAKIAAFLGRPMPNLADNLSALEIETARSMA
jgi:dTDP-4-dehydrorhamnose reductase